VDGASSPSPLILSKKRTNEVFSLEGKGSNYIYELAVHLAATVVVTDAVHLNDLH